MRYISNERAKQINPKYDNEKPHLSLDHRQNPGQPHTFACGHSGVLPERGKHNAFACYHAHTTRPGVWSCRFCDLSRIRQRKYGIDTEKVNARVRKQKGCAICHSLIAGGRGDWHPDHNHKTGKIRGILCQNCNLALGLFKDSPKLLSLALSYLLDND